MTNSRTSLRRLGSGAAIYGIATVVSRAASMIMLPVYTRVLHPSDYGILQMLDLSVEVLSLFLSAGATAGVMRFYYSTDNEVERRRLLASAFFMLFGLELIGALALAVAAPFVVGYLLGPTGTTGMILLAATNFMLGSLTTLPMFQYQVEERAKRYAIISVTRLLIQLSLNLLFLLKFKMGPLGILWSSFATSLLVGGYCTIYFIRENGWQLSRLDMARLKRFAIPYQLASAGGFLLTFGDRFVLRRYFTIDIVGLYGLAYQVGFLLVMVTSGPLLQAWTPIRHQEARLPKEERDRLFNRSFLLLSVVTIAGALGLALFATPVLRVVAGRAYWPAATVVPVVALAFVIRSWSDAYTFNFDIAEKPRYIALGTWLSVALIAVLYFLLIPKYGGLGAAMSVAAAFTFRLGLYWHFSQRVWPIQLQWRRHAAVLLTAVTTYAVWEIVDAQSLAGQLAAATSCFAGFSGISWMLLPLDVRVAMMAEFRKRLQLPSRLLGER